MISYENANETEIKDIFIGSNVNILDNNTIEYLYFIIGGLYLAKIYKFTSD